MQAEIYYHSVCQMQPSEEESTVASLLDAAIAEAVSDLGQFDVLDDIDLFEQSEDVSVAANATQSDSNAGRRKRGIERMKSITPKIMYMF